MKKEKTEKMEKIKLTEDEIKELTDIRNNFSNLTLMIGETVIGVANLENRKQELLNGLAKITEKQNDISKKLEDKYGEGNISLETGEFSPTKK
jgi:predicted  nucleic acid-binding Zn-ribbon protein